MQKTENNNKQNPHEGHRSKLKNRFIKEGLDHFEDHNILELILFFAIPRRDTNEIAHALLKRFGSFSRVLEASIKELCEVDGIGEHAALLLKTFPAVSKRYYKSRFQPSKKLPRYQDMGQDLVLHFAGRENEELLAIFYNNGLTYAGQEVLQTGNVNTIAVSFRRLCDALVRMNASYVLLAHNHPHGRPIASSEDLDTTKRLQNFLMEMNVTLIDHFIVAEGRYSSTQSDRYYYLRKHILYDKPDYDQLDD